MNWNDQLLRKLMATQHKPKDQSDAIHFACMIITDATMDDQLSEEDAYTFIMCKQLIRSAFSQYLHDGRRSDWNDTMEAVKEDLINLSKNKEDRDGN